VHESPHELNKALLILVGLLVAALVLQSWLLLVVAGLFAVTATLAFFWGKYALERVEYHRKFARSRCFVGEEVELTVELTNRKVLPVTYLLVDDTVPDELEITSRKIQFSRMGQNLLRLLFGLTWYQKVIRHYKVTPKRRGYYRLGPALIKGGDPFGYISRTREEKEPENLIVYPRVMSLQAVGIPSQRPFGDLKSRNRLFEDPMRFAGVREYQPGDPLNRIHWKASATAGHLQVKLLDPSANMGLAIFLNTWSADLFWMGGDIPTMEAGCVLAASIVNWAVEQGVPIGLYSNGHVTGWGANLRLPPSRGPQVLTQALEGLARLHMVSRQSAAELLLDEIGRVGYGSSVVVITRSIYEDLAAAIMKVHRSGRPVTVVRFGTHLEPAPRLPGVTIHEVPGEEALHAAVLA
jgi:uncharacterized protein (DUF58 family)